MAARATSNGVTRQEVKETVEREARESRQALTDSIVSMRDLMKTGLEGIRAEISAVRDLQTERITNDRLLNNERHEGVLGRLDSLEDEGKRQKWWHTISTFMGALLGFGGTRFIK